MKRFAFLFVLAACDRTAPREEAKPPPAVAPIVVVDAAVAPVAPPANAFPMRKMVGPFASLDAYCKILEDLDEPGHAIACDTKPRFTGKRTLVNPTKPFDEARLFVVESLDPHCQLGLRLGKSWWVLPEAVRCLGERAKSTLSSKVITFEVIADAVVIRAVYNQSTEEYSPDVFERSSYEICEMCSIGASGAPTCTIEIPTEGHREAYEHGKKTTTNFKVTVYRGDGKIKLVGDTSDYASYLVQPLEAKEYDLIY